MNMQIDKHTQVGVCTITTKHKVKQKLCRSLVVIRNGPALLGMLDILNVK